MKNIKKLNIYLQVAIVAFILVFATAISKVIFVLLPLYGLAGQSLEADEATKAAISQKLENITLLNDVTTWLIYVALAVGFITFSIGIYQITKHRTSN